MLQEVFVQEEAESSLFKGFCNLVLSYSVKPLSQRICLGPKATKDLAALLTKVRSSF